MAFNLIKYGVWYKVWQCKTVAHVQAVEMDFAMGSAISDDIVPQAFKYYTGQAQAEMSEDEDSLGDSEYDDDASDDDDEDALDEDDGDDPTPLPAGPGASKEECKQQ